MIPPPTVLAALPGPAGASAQPYRSATVQHLVRKKSPDAGHVDYVRRRKSREVVIAGPGGAVAVYDFRTGRQVTSYAAPPDNEVVCAPVCALLAAHRRITVVAQQTARKSGRLILWEERPGLDIPLKERIRTFQCDAEVENLATVQLSLVAGTDGPDEYRVVVVQKDGSVTYWGEGLKESINAKVALGEHQIAEAFVVSVEQARKGVLRNRDDILAVASARNVQEILVVLTCMHEKMAADHEAALAIHFWGLQKHGFPSESHINGHAIETLGSIALPTPFDFSTGSHRFTVYGFGTRVFASSVDRVSVIDLTHVVPKLTAELSLPHTASMTPISDAVVAWTDSRVLEVLDTRHQAVLASASLEQEPTNGVPKQQSIDLLTFIPSLGVVAAIHERRLLSFQVERSDTPEQPRKRFKHTTLADAVGRGLKIAHGELSAIGSRPLGIGTPFQVRPLADSWKSQAEELEELARRNERKAFDRLAFEQLQGPGKKDRKTTTRVQGCVIDHILGSMFVPGDKPTTEATSQGYPLQLRIWAGKTIEWLQIHRHFSQSHIEGALHRIGKLPVTETLAPTALVNAVAAASPTWLHLLKQVVSVATTLDARELMCVVRHALERLQRSQAMERTALLIADDAGSGVEAPTATKPNPQLTAVAHNIIRLAIARLTQLHPSVLPDAMTAELTSAHLFTLIDHLRLALAQRGWFSRHADPLPAAAEFEPDLNASLADPYAHSARAATLLLNAALDALGAHGWLLRRSAPAAATLAHMRAEVAAALEGVEEAAHLSGLLGEVLQFAATIPPNTPVHDSRRAPPRLLATRGPLAAALLPGTAPAVCEDPDPDPFPAALPLGMRYVPPEGPAAELELSALGKVVAGGAVVARTPRDIGRLKSMRVDVHSVERIIL